MTSDVYTRDPFKFTGDFYFGSATHIAGPAVEFQGRVIQRCIGCGKKLRDSKHLRYVLKNGQPDPSMVPYPTHEPGMMILEERCVASPGLSSQGVLPPGCEPPDNFCGFLED